MSISTLLSGALVTGAGSSRSNPPNTRPQYAFQATVIGTGAVTATVLIQVSNNATDWMTLGTITLSGTTSASDGFAHEGSWEHCRANCTAVSGTSAAVTVTVGLGY